MSLPSTTRLAEEYLAKALDRETKGLAVYGDFDPYGDKRILSVEAQEECIDILNYLRFYEKKFGKAEKVTGIKQQAFRLYVELRRLELAERTLSGG